MTEEQRIEVKTKIICGIINNWKEFKFNLSEEEMVTYIGLNPKDIKEISADDAINIASVCMSKYINTIADSIIERF